MNYYPPTQQRNDATTADELVDERWDDNLGYYSRSNNHTSQNSHSQESSVIKDRQLETLFQNLSTTSRQIPPPLNENKDDFNTPCFKEDLDVEEEDEDYTAEKGYFQENSSPVIIANNTATPLTTPPLSPVLEVEEEENCDYLTAQDAIVDNDNNNKSILESKQDNDNQEEDFSITSVNDLSPNEYIQVEQQQEQQTIPSESIITTAVAPVNFEDYHYSLVKRYKDILLSLVDANVMQSLPEIYNNYIRDIRDY